jgi:nuclear receptor
MSVSAVQQERGPRHLRVIKALPKNSNKNILTQILITCIRQAQQNHPQFNLISKQQRDLILRHVWSELFILRASHWPIDISNALEGCFCGDINLMDIIRTTKALNADLMELSMLEALILSRPDLALDSRELSQLNFNLESAALRLAFYVSTTSSQAHDDDDKSVVRDEISCVKIPLRFSKLLLALRHLTIQQHRYKPTLNNLFHDIAEIK